MPVTPKSPRSSRKTSSGPVKTKGAVRAKSGCYTCRIRRKKCDEKRISDNGPCETCFRLKLECLGFGAKRPDWLRESSKVSVIRDRIKNHLASQGMIKGHSGSGSRNAIHLDTLKLSDFQSADGPHQSGSASSSSGSPARDMSVESDHPSYGRGPMVNTQLRPVVYGYDYYPGHPTVPYHRGHLAADYMSSEGHLDLQSSGCVSPNSDTQAQYDDFDPMYHHDSPTLSSEITGTRSLYAKWQETGWLDNLLTIDDEAAPLYDFNSDPAIQRLFDPEPILPAHCIKKFVAEYVANVVKIQYLLGDGTILPQMIRSAIDFHEPSHEAVELLATTYHRRQLDRTQLVLVDHNLTERVSKLQRTLSDRKHNFTSDDAMTALHVVSLYLFDGGQGSWNDFLPFASHYVISVLQNPTYMGSPSYAFTYSSEKDQFVIKTTIWFDVLASITTQHRPILLPYIDELFNPQRSHVGDDPRCSMLSPMGCTNDVLWAMAKASELACWKKTHHARGDLSITGLVTRAQEIETFLAPPLPQPQPPPSDKMETALIYTSEIFRTATKLLLSTVVNNDLPNVVEVRQATDDLMAAIDAVSRAEYTSAVVRSTVFPIFICGAFVTDLDHQRRLAVLLEQGPGSEGVGNCSTILKILKGIWCDTARKKNDPVRWRKKLKEARILLV